MQEPNNIERNKTFTYKHNIICIHNTHTHTQPGEKEHFTFETKVLRIDWLKIEWNITANFLETNLLKNNEKRQGKRVGKAPAGRKPQTMRNVRLVSVCLYSVRTMQRGREWIGASKKDHIKGNGLSDTSKQPDRFSARQRER